MNNGEDDVQESMIDPQGDRSTYLHCPVRDNEDPWGNVEERRIVIRRFGRPIACFPQSHIRLMGLQLTSTASSCG